MPKFVFFGTPHFSVIVLQQLKAAGILPALIVTAPDKPQGRGLVLTSPPVKTWAIENDIPYIQPTSLTNDPSLDPLINSEWQAFVVVAYGKILKKQILDLPFAGTINVHPSLLPRFRGASPIESQILADEKEVGVSLMLLDEEMDHGPVIAQARITPDPWPLKASLLEEILATEGGSLLAEVLPLLVAESQYDENDADTRTLFAVPQEHENATFTRKIQKEDGRIDLAGDAYANYLKFCAYDGWPGIFTEYQKKDGTKVRIKITDAVYIDATFVPTKVVPEGKKEMSFEDFLRGV